VAASFRAPVICARQVVFATEGFGDGEAALSPDAAIAEIV
jgi:hypothetical protein